MNEWMQNTTVPDREPAISQRFGWHKYSPCLLVAMEVNDSSGDVGVCLW
jgi:hypothetical protein